ncbi:MAG: phospholipase D family protein [Desulfuromonas sp.]|nr:MAG: phospholipase D family protein [Desulfuromonas sp.]
MNRFCLFLFFLLLSSSVAAAGQLQDLVTPLLIAHPDRSGAYVLDKGEEALLARAWLVDHAVQSIDVQYFIWSDDNIGTLATESLLRAAERGVQVRVIVDDLLVQAPDDFLLALAAHPAIEIRIYNPQHKTGVSTGERLWNIFSNFRAANQRMHDKTFIVDRQVAITGGRNMADEYYDYDHEYNFRDRDVLLLGPVAESMTASFETFWNSSLAVPIEQLLDPKKSPDAQQRLEIYAELHAYAQNPENFAPAVKLALENLPQKFQGLIDGLVWDEVRFISDEPGKNSGADGLGGGGRSTALLVDALLQARESVTIQSPYLVLPDGGLELFAGLIARGVKVRISTNSLLSTDNLQAFSGYSKQRDELLEAGIEVFEFQPQPQIQERFLERYPALKDNAPVFAIHAKTLVIDGRTLFIGTFNLDPRSANLNTEVGVIIDNPQLGQVVEQQIERDMAPGNSWNSATDNPDRFAPWGKRFKLGFWKLMPLKDIL